MEKGFLKLEELNQSQIIGLGLVIGGSLVIVIHVLGFLGLF